MRDPKRIDILMAKFVQLWKQMPDMRFHQMAQFIACAGNSQTKKDAFYVEDAETLWQLNQLLKEYQS